MSIFTTPKKSFLSTEAVSEMVKKMRDGGVEVTKSSNPNHGYNVKFFGGPNDINIISPSTSEKENIARDDKDHCTVVWDLNKETKEDPDKVSKTTVCVGVLETTPMFDRLSFMDKEIKRCAVEMLVKSDKEPFNKNTESVDELLEKTTFLIKMKEDTKFNPHMDLVVKSGPKKKKFTYGYITEGFDENGGLVIDEDPSFSWDNLELFVVKKAIMQKIKGTMDYASVKCSGKKISKISLQFQVSYINLSPPVSKEKEHDSDEVVKPRSAKRMRLERSKSCVGGGDGQGNEEEEAASQGDASNGDESE